MEWVLFIVSGASMIYYILLVGFTDASWTTQMYWPVSILIFGVVGWILYEDSRLKKKRKNLLSLKVRTFLCTSSIVYLSLLSAFSLLIIFHAFRESDRSVDYLILIENGDVGTELTSGDYKALDRTMEYMRKDARTKVVLAGSSRFRVTAAEDMELQSEMKKYLLEHQIDEHRIITEEISSNFRQNIIYGYAYVLVDWYFSARGEQEEPRIGIIGDRVSTLRYQMMMERLGKEMEIIHFQESVLVWPARIIEELKLILHYHLEDAFEYGM